MGCAGRTTDGLRLRGLFVVPWRAGLRISEALALAESDLDPARGAILVRRGKGGKPREVGMDQWASVQLQPWLAFRQTVPVGALSCVIYGPTWGGHGRRLGRGGDQHAAALASRERSRRRRRAAGMSEITTEIGPAGPFSCAGGRRPAKTCTRVTQGWAPAVRSRSVACRVGVGVRAPPAA
jgi:integrase